ncbi:hypothetical protein R3P38DRAFT_2889398 [Favolaschia claudopus]|uniref:Uncharacterized protein n=1 Tax=Favolaschia claudopus TaxID=2862362 RepID=A0AAW0CQ79_9AGAR
MFFLGLTLTFLHLSLCDAMDLEGRGNPAPSHFAKNTPIEMHPPVSPRLLQRRSLDREGRAIARIVFAHGIRVQTIARVCAVSDETVISAIENKATTKDHDKAENDYFYVSAEYRNQYPPLPNSKTAPPTTTPAKNISGDQTASMSTLHCSRTRFSSRDSKIRTSNLKLNANFQNPTPEDFQANHSVSSNASMGPGAKLDRRGRAICRIVYRHVGNYSRIAAVFAINHRRVRNAIQNQCSPRDIVAEDYDVAGDAFRHAYPLPSETEDRGKVNKRPQSPELGNVAPKRAKNSATSTTSKRTPSPELGAPPPPKPTKKPAAPTLKRPLEIPIVEIITRPRPKPKNKSEAVLMENFLKDIGGFDLSDWQKTFEEKGLKTMKDLKTLSSLEEKRLEKTLMRLFAGKMSEVHIVLLADALVDLVKKSA